METRFTWNPAKAARNRRIHGVSFGTAIEVFNDPHQIVADNDLVETQGEQRYQIIGMTNDLTLLLVVFVHRNEPNLEVIRLISARKAIDYEKNIYEEQFG